VPSRKQRRRREKAFRHEYEYVEVDDAGNELEVDPSALRKEKDGDRAKAKTPARGTSRRPVREVPPPSWRRAVRRGGLMGAVLLVLMTTLFRAPIVIAIVYAAALIPFTYAVDRISYRTYLRRSGKQQ
jgi:hypothetical protein